MGRHSRNAGSLMLGTGLGGLLLAGAASAGMSCGPGGSFDRDEQCCQFDSSDGYDWANEIHFVYTADSVPLSWDWRNWDTGDDAEAIEAPAAIFLTWQRDPTTTMTIDWHADPDQDHAGIDALRYKKLGTDEWKTIHAQSHAYATSAHWSQSENEQIGSRTVYRVELTSLEPRTKYRFQVGQFERLYKFETIQASIVDDPLIFGAGGDNTGGSSVDNQAFAALNRAALEKGVQFIAFGGDMSYDDGRADFLDRSHNWFEVVNETLITDEGRVIPVVAGIGNHEMNRRRGGNNYTDFPEFNNRSDFENYAGNIVQWRNDNAPYFFSLYAFPGQPGYNVLDFGDYMSLIMLDSDHSNPVGGKQTDWLDQVLQEREHRPHLLPKYHEPGPYSSRRRNENIGTYWIPLFEKYGVRVVFENHDHTMKRTVPIRDGRSVRSWDALITGRNGVVYLGDGAWGKGGRDVQHPNAWYMAHSQGTRHGWIVTLHGDDALFQAFDEDGNIFDAYSYQAEPLSAPPAPGPEVISWHSFSPHGDQDFGMPISSGFVEPRQAGVAFIEIVFSEPVVVDNPDQAVSVTGVNADGTIGLVNLGIDVNVEHEDDRLTVSFSDQLPDASRWRFVLNHQLIKNQSGSSMNFSDPYREVVFDTLVGDFNGDGRVTAAGDLLPMWNVGSFDSQLAAALRADVQGNATLTATDLLITWANRENRTDNLPQPPQP